MFSFDVKIDTTTLKFDFEEDKKGIELKSKIIELAKINLDAINLKVFAAGHYLKDDVILKDQINKEKLKIVLARYDKKDLKPMNSPPKQKKIENNTNNNNFTNNNTNLKINNNNSNNNNNDNNNIKIDLNLNEENVSEEVLNFRRKEWEARKTVEKLVEIAHRIAIRQGDSYDNNTFAVLTDSEGKEFPMTEKDRIGITCGQMLYNFGKKKLFKDKKYDEAIKIFEASEREFLNVSEEILEIIDNYGLLCLDIAWAYYQNQNLEQLQNASEKIKSANSFLEKSYGKEMERLNRVTGGMAPQKVLYARLHLLQGILRFHKGLFHDSISYLKQAEDEIIQFRIEPNDPNFLELLSIGYDDLSARKGLRAAGRDLNGAIQFLSDEQEKSKEISKKERERENERIKEMSYGKTAKGKRLNIRLLNYYVNELGFPERLVAEALKQVDNDEEAVADLLTNPNRRQILETSLKLKREERRRRREEREKRKRDGELIENCKKMVELGFDESLSLSALHQSNHNLENAILFLTENSLSFQSHPLPYSLSQLEENYKSLLPFSPSSSLSNLSASLSLDENNNENNNSGDEENMKDEEQSTPQEDPKVVEERKRKEEEERLSNELEEELKDAVHLLEGDYLNLTLEEEHQVFIKYKSLLESKKLWY